MNATEQAKNGFKTFIITLTLSLALLSVAYYVASFSNKSVDIENSASLGAATTETENTPASYIASSEEAKSVFADLQDDESVVDEKVAKKEAVKAVVLGAADAKTTTQSTVPDTGLAEVTYTLVLSTTLLVLGAYFFIFNPRRSALATFENRVRKNL